MNAPARSTGPTVHLVAQRSGQRFSLPVSSVREVLVMPELEPVPLAPADLIGSFQLRGEIIPAVIPDRLLAIENAGTAPTTLALLRDGDAIVAVAFDRMLGVTTIDPANLLAHPLAAHRPWMPCLHVDPRYQLITVLDGSALLAALVDQLQFVGSPT